MTREEKERLLAEIEKQYKWLMTKSPTIYMMDIAFDTIRKAVRDEAEQEPKISLDTYKQVTKERDIAIEQLHELGYEFGEKIEPTTKNDLGVDCISRKAVVDAFGKWCSDDKNLEHPVWFARDIISMPSITPLEPRWIPVSERLPEDHIEVLLNDGDCMSVGYVYYTWDEKLKWHVDCNDEENNFYLNPIAWMPLPDIQIRK